MESGFISIKGAAEHNLKIDELIIPKYKLVVFTGVSGSGKSSLAFDTLYAEGQRRYVESLSSYARQFLGQLEKPKFEKISGLAPTIAIEQKASSANPRSTVGTITEIYDYMRVLWARIGTQHCHLCGREVSKISTQEVISAILSYKKGTKLEILAPLVVERKGEHKDLLDRAKEKGFVRVRIDGEAVRLDEPHVALSKKNKHSLEIVVDRIVVGSTESSRLSDSVETALKEGSGEILLLAEGQEARRFSANRACTSCKIGFSDLSPLSFSFNSPVGACPSCNGLGTRLEIDTDLLVPDETLSISGGAIRPWAQALARGDGWNVRIFEALERDFHIDLNKPWKQLSQEQRDLVLHGSGRERIRVQWNRGDSHGTFAMRFEGVAKSMLRRLHQTKSEEMREYYQQYLSNTACTDCQGARLKPESRAVQVGGMGIHEVTAMSTFDARDWFDKLSLDGNRKVVAKEVLSEIGARLEFLINVGLRYLTLNRLGPTLSGGEAQRIRLASQLGSELTGVMYILDEPSIGLHPRDDERLLEALFGLRDLGNSVIVVEHDRATIEAADYIVDFGPGAGSQGGRVICFGTPKEIAKNKKSITGRYLANIEQIEVPRKRRPLRGTLTLEGATVNNLKDVTLNLPLGVFVVFTGVSGAGKSSLVSQTLLPALQRKLGGELTHPGPFRRMIGLEQLDKVIHIDQQPIGRTPRSNPATYTKAFDEIRKILSETQEAKAYGFDPGRFSFNVQGGRCEACGGAGITKVEMHFLADVHVPCEICGGQRYNEATLRVRFKNKNVREILDTTISDSLVLFENFPKIRRILKTLEDVGMGYVQLGQQATTLSGGEAQRIKLSRELAKRSTGKTLYILDEPTTGLHFHDIKKLLEVLMLLVDQGNSVAVIEHNLDVIKCADWVIDLGPEGGRNGGFIIAEGTPEMISKDKKSETGRYLLNTLKKK
jgi:excinuclease ABC subunit A